MWNKFAFVVFVVESKNENLPCWIGQETANGRNIQGGTAANCEAEHFFELYLQMKGKQTQKVNG